MRVQSALLLARIMSRRSPRQLEHPQLPGSSEPLLRQIPRMGMQSGRFAREPRSHSDTCLVCGTRMALGQTCHPIKQRKRVSKRRCKRATRWPLRFLAWTGRPEKHLPSCPPGTARRPFVFVADRDYTALILRINATSFKGNPGSVEYAIKILPPSR